jgi:hypothetical protein
MTHAGRHYKDILFRENRARLKLLTHFRSLVKTYFENSILNMVSGIYNEKPEATEAKKAINLIILNAYTIISDADIKTYTASTPSVSVRGGGKNINLILNIFNLGRNEIDPERAIEYIDRAIAVYKANRAASLIRAINPFFWMSAGLKYL